MLIAMNCYFCPGQVIVTPQLQGNGVLQKQQLWDMLLTNSGTTSVMGHIQVVLGDNSTGQPILTGTGKTFSIAPGNLMINAAMMEPIQYTQLNGTYVIDPGPNGFLPLGNFSVCISYFRHESEAVQQIAEECQFIEVEPLSPPQLVMPWNESEQTEKTPLFTWLPPSPASFFSSLNYDLDLVEVFSGQSPSDAIQQNLPLLHQANIIPTSLLYPASAPALEFDKRYAWRISANSNGAVVSRSDIWDFTIKKEITSTTVKTNNLPYVKLSAGEQSAFALQVNYLKFEYVNEANDSTWNIKIYDLSMPSQDTVSIAWDSIPIKYGQNLVSRDIRKEQQFVDKHFYLLELKNQWGEQWRLKFEFRREEE